MQTKLAVLALAAGIALIGWQGAKAVQARATTVDEASTAILGVQQAGTESEVPSATHRKVRIAQKGMGGSEGHAAERRSTYNRSTNKKTHQ
jgi:type II secretory pathway pseudopilin PulG